ncbi:MAG TPA: hypothetical protein VMB50_04855 [Myxococcales bacterium]|nr:hypothetical protein [Myxococcales bacterium]
MRSILVGVAAIGAVAACSQDVCHQLENVAQNQESQLSSCGLFGDAGFAFTAQDLQTCENNLKACTAADQNALSAYASCLDGLPAFQCQWITDAEKGTLDPGFVTYDSDAQACEAKDPSGQPGQAPALSQACLAAGGTTGGGTTGGGSGGSSTGGSFTLAWPGTYTVQSNSTLLNNLTSQSQSLSGTETIVQSGTSVTIQGFAGPVLDCNLTLTLATSTSTFASLPTSQACGSYTVIGGVTAELTQEGNLGTIQLIGSVEDSTGSASSYTVTLNLVSQ